MFLLPSCYGAEVIPNERDWRASGFDFGGQNPKLDQGVVQKLSKKVIAEWANLPPWEGGWSPFLSVCVKWRDGQQYFYKVGDSSKIVRRSRVFYDVKPVELTNLVASYQKSKAV